MYDDLYPEAAQTALDAKAARPPEPKQTPRFSLWGTTAAVPKGVAAGAAQATGSAADILGAFGSVLGTEGSAGGMFSLPTPEEDKQQREATEKLRANGPDYMSEGGRSFRNVAKDYTPDPLTTHAAERIVFDFSRMGSKAITAAATMGGIPGAVVAGAEEGFTVSDQLAQEGVDLGTRSAVGGVTAVTNAVSFALPVAGKTIAQTVGLAAVGGPGSFITQNYAAREILKNADYSKLADQYDPFDPMGIGMAAGLSLVFGGAAMGMRGARQKGAAPLEDSASPAPILTVEKPTANPVGKNGFISAPNGYEVRVGQHTAGSNVLDPEADAGAFIYEVRKGSDDANPLAMVLNKEGKLVSITKVFGGDDKSNGTAWVPPSKSDAAEVLTLLQERAQTEIGSSERQGIDKKIKDIVVGPSESAPTAIKPIADETVDAARTSLLRESVDNSNPLPKDLSAAQPHADAHAKAIDQMASGERVNVADVLPENVAVKATEDMRARMEPLVMQMERPEPPQNMIGTLPVIEAKVADLKLSEDVPQFKSGANDKGVVEPLGGSFDRTGVAPIQIWERLDGRQEVISGRHRLDLARRSGEDTIPAQIHREADGFNAVRAASLDAELNIRDGQGKVKDYVQYFEGNQFTREQADARGLLARATGQRAYTIATDGGPELIATHRAGGLGDEAAVAIARIAPNDPRLQAVGLKAVQDGKTISTATNTMQAVRSIARERADTTGDMFGFDDGAMRDAEAMAAIVSRLQRELSETLAAVQGASKRPEVAKRNGVNIKDPQGLQKRILELQTQKSAWDQWSTNPDLVAQIRAKMGLEPAPKGDAPSAAPPVEPPPPIPDQPQDSAGQGGMFDETPASFYEKEATRLALENPDVMVMVEGMDAPKPLSEVMAMIKKDLADDIEDSNLIQVAAECFISTGAGGT